MAFKIGQIRTPKPSTALDVLLNAEGRKIGSAYDHQGDIIRKYHAEAQEAPDVAFELPTGSGKTLVGVLIAEWRRLNHEARVVYLCPNKQLAYQVADQARTQYGLQVVPLVGIQANFDQGDSSSYRRGEACAVTTYSGLFNAGHYFDDVNTIVLDDAHAAESYIADHWSLHIRADDEPAMFEKMAELIAPLLGDADASRMLAEWESRDGASWSQKIASSELANIADQIRSLLDVHTAASDLVWPWRVVRDHFMHAICMWVPRSYYSAPSFLRRGRYQHSQMHLSESISRRRLGPEASSNGPLVDRISSACRFPIAGSSGESAGASSYSRKCRCQKQRVTSLKAK